VPPRRVGSTVLADHRLDGCGMVLIAPICDLRWKRRNRRDGPAPPLALPSGDWPVDTRRRAIRVYVLHIGTSSVMECRARLG
jgi:hypothetical protein